MKLKSLILITALIATLTGCMNNNKLAPTENCSLSQNPNQTSASLLASISDFTTIDCAILWPACEATGNSPNKVYIFKGNEYIRYDFKTTYADPGYPKSIQEAWAGFGDFTRGFDAGFVNKAGTSAYFFKGEDYIRYDIKARKVDDGYPKKIATYWPGVEKLSKIDTAFLKPGTEDVYFFGGDQYLKFSMASSTSYAGYPKKISDMWGGMTGTFSSDLDAATTNPNDPTIIYFFKGTQYVRYDLTNTHVDPGYPQAIFNNWHINTINPNPVEEWVIPVEKVGINQGFNVWNDDRSGYHLGVDLSKNYGLNIYASGAGEVVTAKYVGANGNCVIIKHTATNGKTFYSGYSHLDSISTKTGIKVEAGDKIGIMGTTGKDSNGNPTSTGVHLHFFMTDTLFNDAYGYTKNVSKTLEVRSEKVVSYNGALFYNPLYVIENNGKLPE